MVWKNTQKLLEIDDYISQQIEARKGRDPKFVVVRACSRRNCGWMCSTRKAFKLVQCSKCYLDKLEVRYIDAR